LHEKPQSQWTHIWGRRFISQEEIAAKDRDEVFKLLEVSWQRFVDEDFPKIQSVIAALEISEGSQARAGKLSA
jgi:hypothetical protein